MCAIQAEIHLYTDFVNPFHGRLRRISLTSGLEMIFTPPAIAALQSPLVRARQAWYIATQDDEQAVSTTCEGPLKPNAYDSLPDKNAGNVPTMRLVNILLNHLVLNVDSPVL